MAGNPTRHRIAAKKSFVATADQLEGHLHQAMLDLVGRQERATVANLSGNRGRRIRKQVRAAGQPPEGDQQPPPPAPPPPDAGNIFPVAAWTAKTAATATPHIRDAVQAGIDRTANQLATTTSSLEGVEQIIQARANRLAGQVTQTTFDQIQQALADGYQQGESIQQLATRIRHVFDVARSRAQTIARTEIPAAMNQASLEFANSRPAGTVAHKEWLAVHDQRTRMTHRVADGQKQPVFMPFAVGGTLMMHPGDPTAPPDETISCRCTMLMVPGTPLTALQGGNP